MNVVFNLLSCDHPTAKLEITSMYDPLIGSWDVVSIWYQDGQKIGSAEGNKWGQNPPLDTMATYSNDGTC
jgi:hypothetical protein